MAQLTGMNATMVATAEEAIEILENSAVDIVLTDLMLPHTSGLELLKRVHDTHANLPVIVLTQYGTIDSAAATRMGAIDYLTKPFRIEELRVRLERASRAVELQQEKFRAAADRALSFFHFSHQQSAQTSFRNLSLTTVLSNGAVLLLGLLKPAP